MYNDHPRHDKRHPSNHGDQNVVLPSIGRIFDQSQQPIPSRHGELTLPPLVDAHGHRSSQSAHPSQMTVQHSYPSRSATQNYYLPAQPPRPDAAGLYAQPPSHEPRGMGYPQHYQGGSHYPQPQQGGAAMQSMSRAPHDPHAYPPSQDPRYNIPYSEHRPSSSDVYGHRTPSPTQHRNAPYHAAALTRSSSSSGPSRHECPICGKKFSRPSGLKIHVTTHTGEKPYICPEEGCGRAFSVQSNMRRHVRIVHHGASEDYESGDEA